MKKVLLAQGKQQQRQLVFMQLFGVEGAAIVSRAGDSLVFLGE